MPDLKIYTKKDCHLCDIAKKELSDLQNEMAFSIIEVDIENDREALEKYKHLIPVIEIDGKIMFTGRINRDRLKSALTQKSRS